MRNRYDSLAKISQCQRPVFIASARHDELIPFVHGERLFEAATEPKQFFAMDGGHNDGMPPEFFAPSTRFSARA